MECKIIFNEGSWVTGRRVNFTERMKISETKGTHHWIVSDSNDKTIIGKRIAIPINSMKYLVVL
jgi:hypothetical protein